MDFALVNTAHASVDSFIGSVNAQIVNPLIQLLFALALVLFAYGVFEFLSNPEKEDEKTKGKTHMMWGLVGLAIMFAVWGLLNIVIDTFDIKGIDPDAEKVGDTVNLDNYAPNLPQLND